MKSGINLMHEIYITEVPDFNKIKGSYMLVAELSQLITETIDYNLQMRETKAFLLLLLLTTFLLAPASSSITLECGECWDKSLISECLHLKGLGVNNKEHPLSPGQHCSSLNLDFPLVIFNCGQQSPEQCEVRNTFLTRETSGWNLGRDLAQLMNHLLEDIEEQIDLRMQKWCACSSKKEMKNLYQENIGDGESKKSRYLEEELKSVKEDTNKEEKFELKNHENDDPYCPWWCILLSIIFWGLVIAGIIASIYCCCKAANNNSAVVVTQPQPQPMQPQYQVNNDQIQPGSERQFRNYNAPQ